MQIKITVIEDQKQAVTSEFVEASTAIEYLSKFVTPLEQHAAIDKVLDEEKEEELEDEVITEEQKDQSGASPESPSSSQPADAVGSPDGEIKENTTELSPEEARG